LFSISRCFGQQTLIAGTISDANTREVLPLATIFINNTTISAASAVNGQYSLRNIPAGPIEVVVSYIGYESSRTKLIVHDGDRLLLNIKLTPSMVELPGAQVSAKRDKDWEKQYRKFEKIFLGENPTNAKIINPGIINFQEIDKGKVLLAEASETLEIVNPGLGYRIFYYMREFQSDKESFSIVGDMRFEELKEKDDIKMKQWTKNRRDIYLGSLRHLLVSLVQNKISEEGFKLYVDLPGFNESRRASIFSMNKGVVPLKLDSVVSPGARTGEFKIFFKKRVEVHYVHRLASIKTYNDIPWQVGWIDPTKDVVEVDENGTILNLAHFITSGYLSNARIASLLPSDYRP